MIYYLLLICYLLCLPTKMLPLCRQRFVSVLFTVQCSIWNSACPWQPGDYPSSGVEPTSLASLALASGFCTSVPLGKPSTSLWRLVTAVPSGRAKCDRVTLTDSQIQDLRMKNSTP